MKKINPVLSGSPIEIPYSSTPPESISDEDTFLSGPFSSTSPNNNQFKAPLYLPAQPKLSRKKKNKTKGKKK